MILYLHGFRSAPASFKASLLAQYMQQSGQGAHWICPQLPSSPAQALALARDLISQACSDPAQQLCLIGSSLGGYYATALAEEFACRAVLLNPAVFPARDLQQHLGHSTQFHSAQPFEFKAEYLAELEAMAVPQISQPERYFLLAATGDEVLDWREMQAHYPHAQQLIIQGSDHGIADFADYLPQVLRFAGHFIQPDAGTPS